MKQKICLGVLMLPFYIAVGQQNNLSYPHQFVDLGMAFGNAQNSVSASYLYNWHLGEKRKFFIGTGARLTSYFGNNKYFTSAPGKLASDDKKTDSLFAPKPSVTAFNVVINLGYQLSSKLQVGFNIDALGFSFGPTGSPTYNGIATKAKPTSGNILLIGNNDKGTLNSHAYLRYSFNQKWGMSAAYEYLFTELTTTTNVQTLPELNNRFRNKASQFYVGLSYKIQ